MRIQHQPLANKHARR
jgi:hypothetical protein